MKKILVTISVLFLLIINISSSHSQGNHPGLLVKGRHLYTPCNDKIIIRGVNKMIVWTDDLNLRKQSYTEIRKTGANCVRIVWLANPSNGEVDAGPAGLDRTIQDCIDNDMIPMVELHDATGDWAKLNTVVNYWLRQDVINVVKKHEKYLLVNIANECGDDQVTNDQFKSGYETAVAQLRAAGIHTPLVIDAADWGKNLEMLVATGSYLINKDPDKNLLFSVHTYWAIADGADEAFITGQFQAAVAANLPFIVGEYAAKFNQNVQCVIECDYKTIIKRCQENEIGWLAWEWGPGNEFADPTCEVMNMTMDSYYNTLKDGWAKEVALTSAYSIAQTSRTPKYIINGGRCEDAPFLLTQASVNFGNTIVGQSTTQMLAIQNTGGTALNITKTSISPADFTIVSGGGARIIPVGGSVNIQLRFSPATSGNKLGILAIESDASNGSPIFVALDGDGIVTVPIVTVSTNSLDFGSVIIGSNLKKSVTVSNSGNAALTITSPGISGVDASHYSISHSISGTINPSGSDYFEITFAPGSVGTKSASLSFNTNDVTNSTINIDLSGIGSQIAQPHISLNTNILDFGTTPLGSSVTRDVEISNTGGAVLTITSQTVNGSGFTLKSMAAGSVNPSSNTIAQIEFHPATGGQFQGTFEIASNDPTTPIVTVTLRGTGSSGPKISLSRTIIDYGNVPLLTSKIEDFIVRNIGTDDLVITQQTISGADALQFSINQPASTPIVAGGSSTVRIRHLSTSGGNKSAKYIVQTNDPASPTTEVALISTVVGVEKLPLASTDIKLDQNYPNPFNPTTTIGYSLKKRSNVVLRIQDLLGRIVSTVVSESQSAGEYSIQWDAAMQRSGLYIYRIDARPVDGSSIFTDQKIMMLVR